MKHLSILLKPASSLCNMRCRYCFYADVSSHRSIQSFGLMNHATVKNLLTQIFASLENGDALSIAFQGGEPTLAGLPFFEHFTQAVAEKIAETSKQISLSWALQTNGLVLDDLWCSFLHRHHFLVGLSLDGDAALHDTNRVDAQGKGTFRRILAAKACLERHKVEYNILWVLTNSVARFPQKVWAFLQNQNIHFVQFIPCLPDLDPAAPSPHALTPQRFASFYKGLFRLWETALGQGRYTSVKLFDDVCNLLGRGSVTACGLTGQCQHQCVVEADGSVYPCDFYVLDEWRTGDLTTDSFDEIAAHGKTTAFLQRPRTHGAVCASCPYHRVCGGGCPRMASAMYLHKNGTACGYKSFLDACGASLQEIGLKFAQQ